MKGLTAGGALPWKRMTNRTVVNSVDHAMPEDSYDIMKAIEAKTHRMKPRSIALANFKTTTARDEKLLKTSDAYVNVLLENTREERENEILERRQRRLQELNDTF